MSIYGRNSLSLAPGGEHFRRKSQIGERKTPEEVAEEVKALALAEEHSVGDVEGLLDALGARDGHVLVTQFNALAAALAILLLSYLQNETWGKRLFFFIEKASACCRRTKIYPAPEEAAVIPPAVAAPKQADPKADAANLATGFFPAVAAGESDELMRATLGSSEIDDHKAQVSTEYVAAFLHTLITLWRELLRRVSASLVLRLLSGLLLTYSDLGLDLRVLAVHVESQNSGAAIGTGCFIVIPLLLHAAVSWLNKEGLLRVVLAFCGGKPLAEVYDVCNGSPVRPGASLSPDQSLACTRCIELSLESIPQTLLQMSFFLTYGGKWIVLLSIASSLLATGFIAASTDCDIDSSARLRRIEPLVYGWYPLAGLKRTLLLLSETVRFASASAGRLFAFAVLVAARGGVSTPLLVVVALDLALFTLLRLATGTLTYFDRGMGKLNYVCHIVLFILTEAAPLNFLRTPYFLGPRITKICLVYTSVSNFVLVHASYNWLGTDWPMPLPEESALRLLAASTGFFCLTSVLGIWLMEPGFRKRWLLEHRTPKSHFRDYVWMNNIYDDFGPTLDDHRARALAKFVPEYWDRDLVEGWLQENWATWESDKPEWFTPEWKSLIPQDLLPTGVDVARPKGLSARLSALVWRNSSRPSV